MDKTKLRLAAAIPVAVCLTAAGAVGASAAQAADPYAGQPRLIRAQSDAPANPYYAPPTQYYSPPEGYYVRDQYGRFFYYDPYRQPYAYAYPNNGLLYRDQYGRYFYYNPSNAAPY